MIYEWLATYQQELLVDMSSVGDVFTMAMAFVQSVFICPIELLFVCFIIVFGSADDLNLVPFIDIKVILISIIFGGLFYRLFLESSKVALGLWKWVLYRFSAYMSALFATLTCATFLSGVVTSKGVLLTESLKLSLNSYLVVFFLLVTVVAAHLLRGGGFNYFKITRNSLGKGL